MVEDRTHPIWNSAWCMRWSQSTRLRPYRNATIKAFILRLSQTINLHRSLIMIRSLFQTESRFVLSNILDSVMFIQIVCRRIKLECYMHCSQWDLVRLFLFSSFTRPFLFDVMLFSKVFFPCLLMFHTCASLLLAFSMCCSHTYCIGNTYMLYVWDCHVHSTEHGKQEVADRVHSTWEALSFAQRKYVIEQFLDYCILGWKRKWYIEQAESIVNKVKDTWCC